MVNMTGMGVSEARFYEEVGPWLPVRTPGVWQAAHDLETDGYIMVFDDLSAVGATQPTQEEADALDFASQVMEAFARFHASMYGSDRVGPAALQWIGERTHNYGSPEGDAILRMGIQAFGDQMPPVFHEMAEPRTSPRAGAQRVLFEGTQTLIHGDCHIGNMLRDADGPILLDWAMVGAGPGLRDVAYFIGNSIPHEVRQHHEQDLLRTYLAALAANGVEMASRRCMGHLRLQIITGWIAASMTASMGDTLQPLEIGMRATERSNKALEEDVEVLRLLRQKLGCERPVPTHDTTAPGSERAVPMASDGPRGHALLVAHDHRSCGGHHGRTRRCPRFVLVRWRRGAPRHHPIGVGRGLGIVRVRRGPEPLQPGRDGDHRSNCGLVGSGLVGRRPGGDEQHTVGGRRGRVRRRLERQGAGPRRHRRPSGLDR